MIYRGMYHFSVAYEKGLVTDPIKYFADPQNRDLVIVKRERKPHTRLIVYPFPATQRSPQDFFSNPPLTNSATF